MEVSKLSAGLPQESIFLYNVPSRRWEMKGAMFRGTKSVKMKIRQRIIKEVQHVFEHLGSCFDCRPRWITATCHWIYVRIWPPMRWCCNTLIASGSMPDPACSVPSVACVLRTTVAVHYATSYLFPAHRYVKGYIAFVMHHNTIYIYGYVTGNICLLPFNGTVFLVSNNKDLPCRFCLLRYKGCSNTLYYLKP